MNRRNPRWQDRWWWYLIPVEHRFPPHPALQRPKARPQSAPWTVIRECPLRRTECAPRTPPRQSASTWRTLSSPHGPCTRYSPHWALRWKNLQWRKNWKTKRKSDELKFGNIGMHLIYMPFIPSFTYSSIHPSTNWLIDWLADWLIGWLIDWSINWLVDWLIDEIW